jgi:DNA repair protein RadC
LQRAGKLLGIELLDHLILASGGWVSFLEKGWL